jgi:hypothetical protein
MAVRVWRPPVGAHGGVDAGCRARAASLRRHVFRGVRGEIQADDLLEPVQQSNAERSEDGESDYLGEVDNHIRLRTEKTKTSELDLQAVQAVQARWELSSANPGDRSLTDGMAESGTWIGG